MPTFSEFSAPEAPADIKVVVSSPQSMFVSWLPPIEPNGLITKYNLYTRVVNGREELNHEKRNLPSQQLYYESKGLQPHIEYQYWVTASTRVGEGKSSKVATAITTTRVAARIVDFGGPVIRAWRSAATLPCTAVGKPKREWYRNELPIRMGNTMHNAQLLDSGDLQLSNLQLIDTGNYSCQVDNGIGSDRLTYNVIVQVPPGSPVLYVTSATSSSILLHWKDSNNGNAPVSGYTLHYRRLQAALEDRRLSRHASSHELKTLRCGSTYQVYLTSTNTIGTSPPSTTLHVRTQGQSPATPAPSALLAPNSTSCVLRLHAWPDNGCQMLFFVLQYRAISGDGTDGEWILVSNALKPQRRFTIAGLLPSTLYQLKMEAHNVAGVSKTDFTFVTLTKDGGEFAAVACTRISDNIYTCIGIFADPPSPELIKRGHRGTTIFYANYNIVVPAIAAASCLVCTIVITIFCYKQRRFRYKTSSSVCRFMHIYEIKNV